MARPSIFGKRKPEILEVIRSLSDERRSRKHRLSLTDITNEIRNRFKGLPKPPVKKPGKVAEVDSLKHVVYRLCKSNSIWFGDPSKKAAK